MPAAGAATARAADGSSQNGEIAEKMPIAQKQTATNASCGLVCSSSPDNSSPAAPSSIANAV